MKNNCGRNMRTSVASLANLANRTCRLIAQSIMILLLCIGFFSCDSMGEMYDDLTQKVPICVDASSTASAPDGRGWGNAYITINDAVTNAPDGSEIWIKKGTYTLIATINVNKSISLYGGFDGSESRRGNRSSDASKTIIDGSGMQIISVTGSSGKIVIDGITFSRGNSVSDGGAISVTGALSLTVRNSIFSGNTTNENGGAIAFSGTGVFTISDSTFTGNDAIASGGAICCSGESLEVSDCVFGDKNLTAVTTGVSNTVMTNGGAIYTYNCDTDIRNSYFYYNRAWNKGGGGVYLTGTGTAHIGNSSFIGNMTVRGAGGGVYLYQKGATTIDYCFINGNSAGDDDDGGGGISISGASSDVKINRTVISNNSTTGDGGGIWQYAGELEIKNSLISDNSAAASSQIHCDNRNMINRLYNCTIAAYNVPLGTLQSGTIVNCVIFGRNVTLTGGYFYNVATNIAIADYTENNNPQTISESDFVDFAAHNYRPASSSRLRNNGRTVSDIGTLDLDGNPRVRGAIDIGAYEAQ